MLRIHRTRLSQIKLSHLSWLGLAGTVSCCALVLVFGLMLFPSLPQATYAAPEAPTVSSTIDASVSISLPASIDFASVTPTPSGATTTATASLTVATTDSAGYSLYLYSSDGDSSLRPKISSLANISSINAIAGDVGLTLSNLEPNTGGYNLGTTDPNNTTTYTAVPTNSSTPIQTKDTSSTNSANDTYTLSFGAKLDTLIPSGAYSNTLTISVVAEPKAIPLSGLTYMQEMTPKNCAASSLNESKRLIDSRDGKYYWVAKLADGNCWMTQNLDYDLNTNIALTPNDSDVSSNWTPPRSTSTSIFDNSTFNETYSYDPGMYVKTNPTSYTRCSGATALANASCSSAGWEDVSGMTPMTDERTDGTVISGSTYDAHYLVGNYYQWNAAGAGTYSSTDRGSICPKGWELPTFVRYAGTNDRSFYYLLQQYNLHDEDSYNSDSASAIVSSPLYLVPSGSVYSGELSNAGSQGAYWMNDTASTNGYTYGMSFAATYIDTGWSSTNWFGYPVRCIAR